MTDVVVTVPMSFGLDQWIEEGDLPGEEWSGMEYAFYLGGHAPNIEPGERVYVVYHGLLRGYAPLVRLEKMNNGFKLIRRGNAVAVSIPDYIKGFRGFRYRWWRRSDEFAFPDWMEDQPDSHPAIKDLP